jgi:hypothetical protein
MAGTQRPQLDLFRNVHLVDFEQRPAIFRSWERVRYRRARWLVECLAEMVNGPYICYYLSVLNIHSSAFSAIVMQVRPHYKPTLTVIALTTYQV